MKRIEDLFILHVYIVSSRLLDFVYSRVKLSTPWVIKLSYFNLPILGGMDYSNGTYLSYCIDLRIDSFWQ